MKALTVAAFGMISLSCLSACTTAPGQSRYAGAECAPYACAPMPIQDPCCYPQPVMYAPAPITTAISEPYVAPEPPAPAPAILYAPAPVYTLPPPPVVMSYPAPPAPLPFALPKRK